jgi:ribosome-binding protein aMBF1 (putative translation factor)
MKPAGASSTEKPQQKRNKTEKNKKDSSNNTIQTRSRANSFGDMARKAVEDGGSSYNDLSALIKELKPDHA